MPSLLKEIKMPISSGTAWGAILNKAFTNNKNIRTGRPTVIVTDGTPAGTAAKVGVLAWDKTNSNAYICTVASGTWVKINA